MLTPGFGLKHKRFWPHRTGRAGDTGNVRSHALVPPPLQAFQPWVLRLDAGGFDIPQTQVISAHSSQDRMQKQTFTLDNSNVGRQTAPPTVESDFSHKYNLSWKALRCSDTTFNYAE